MKPGYLDERVSVEEPSTTENDYNEVVEGYSTVGSFWARWQPTGSGEQEQATKIEGNIDGMFTLRRSTATKAITHRYRVVRSNGEVYMVNGMPVYDRDRGMYMTVPARRVLNG